MMRAVVLLLMLAAAPAGAVQPCDPCSVSSGTYLVHQPPSWDGHAPLPLLMFLHGHSEEGADALASAAVVGPADRLGFLLVAPNGVDGAWSHEGSPSQARDDRTFLRSVLADVKRRWPIDPRLVVLGGFSQGASMVWDMACFAPLGFTAFLPFSGGFWERMPTACTAPVNLRHVHGTADATVPLAGRVVRLRWREADIFRGFEIWRETDRCTAPAERRAAAGGLQCQVWSCRTRRTLALCLQPDGHEIEAAWVADGLRWARTVSAP
jgi:polyhydroxybutyrate depolymerase